MAQTVDHPSTQTIYERVRERVPTMSLDTVCRNLWLLSDLGLIATMGPPRERARFDTNMTPHHHFVCTQCGMATDFYSPEFDELRPPAEAESIGSVDATHVELRGLCLRCRKSEKKGK